MKQLGSYGGGNHFGECEVVHVEDNDRARKAADVFGMKDGHVAFLSHCGSRGIGHNLADGQFKSLQAKFARWDIPLPGNDRELVYAPLGTAEADAYIDDMALGCQLCNGQPHADQRTRAGSVSGDYSRNDRPACVLHQPQHRSQGSCEQQHRLGSSQRSDSRVSSGHHSLKGTRYESTGHPILLPGNPQAGSSVMVADEGASISCYSVNHGAGRALGRKRAIRELDQKSIDQSFDEHDILSNCRQYPKDEAPAAYKDFNEVLRSVKSAGLATEVARLKARFVIKDGDAADD
jgi:tRNA-splicing ligase RtcB